MKTYTLQKIANILGGRIFLPQDVSAEGIIPSGVSVDTRTICKNELFFALVAVRDGHSFLPVALAKGACAAVVEHETDCRIPQIVVENSFEAIGTLARHFRANLSTRFIAITGSVGKTSTREMTAAALGTKFSVHSSRRNFNNLIGLPLTILEIDETVPPDFAIVELGISECDEMQKLTQIAQPDAAVITAIAPVHLEGMGNIETIFAEKFAVTYGMKTGSPLFVNSDCMDAKLLEKVKWQKIYRYGTCLDCDFIPFDVKFFDAHANFKIQNVELTLAQIGKPPLYAALAAFAVAAYFGVNQDIIAEILSTLEAHEHRMQLLRSAGVSIIDDSYNASPLAVAESLKTLELVEGFRHFAILGDMFELGKHEDEYHAHIGDEIRRQGLDGVVFFGTLMKNAVDAAKRCGYEGILFWTVDFDEACDFLCEALQPGDVILVKGSHGMNMFRFVEFLQTKGF